MSEDTDLLLALLNSRPIVDGVERDELREERAGLSWARAHDGAGTAAELEQLRDLRERLTDVVLGRGPASDLAGTLDGVHRKPALSETGVDWELVVPPGMHLPVRVVLAWAWVTEHLPGRLRPCGNEECQLFLLDRSKANKARWCSMSVCGNRMKARRHYERSRATGQP